MTTMLTCSGRTIDLLTPRQADVDIDDIAWHLTQINRFGGACRRPYSVAEHSVLVADIFSAVHPGANPAAKLAALMHDAHEAYTNDMLGPIKQVMRVLAGDAWDRFEELHAHCVHARFGILSARASWKAQIKRADDVAYRTERNQLTVGEWFEPQSDPPPADWVDLVRPASLNWAQIFRDRFDEYGEEIRIMNGGSE
jgi:hypothetical protein